MLPSLAMLNPRQIITRKFDYGLGTEDSLEVTKIRWKASACTFIGTAYVGRSIRNHMLYRRLVSSRDAPPCGDLPVWSIGKIVQEPTSLTGRRRFVQGSIIAVEFASVLDP